MRHNRDEVIQRTMREFESLDRLIANLTNKDWERNLIRPEAKDPWTVKDAVAHITHWKADVIRSMRGQRKPADESGLGESGGNHLIFVRWHDRSPQEVLDWHRQVQKDLLAALKEAPEKWFSGKEHKPEWPFDLEGHSAYPWVKDIERALMV